MKKLLVLIPIVLLSVILTILFFDGCEVDPNATYRINYYGNGSDYGYPPVDRNEYLSGMETTVLGKNSLIKTDYTFQGWNTRADGSGTSYNEGDKIEIINLAIFLYAVWEKDE